MLMCCYSKLGHDVLLMSPAQVSARVQTDGPAPPIMSKVDKNHLFLILLPSVSQSVLLSHVCLQTWRQQLQHRTFRTEALGLSGFHNSATLRVGRQSAFRCTWAT